MSSRMSHALSYRLQSQSSLCTHAAALSYEASISSYRFVQDRLLSHSRGDVFAVDIFGDF